MKHILVFLIIVISACTKTEYELLPPQLEVEVTDSESNPVHGANVSLFQSQDDWEQGENKVMSGETDASGQILFEELDEDIYFISAESESLNNKKDVVTFEDPLEKGEKRIIKTQIQ